MVQVCQGTKTKGDMLEETIVQYQEMFMIARREFEKVVSVRPFFRGVHRECKIICTECPPIS
jgi:DNA topoisomerase III